jgi:cyanophycinase
VRFDNAEESMQGRPLTLSYLRVGIVGAGYTFNLRERELDLLVESRARGDKTQFVRAEGMGV